MINLAYLMLLARFTLQEAPSANFADVAFKARKTNYQLRLMLKHQAIEPALSRLLSICDENTLFLDIGANIGLFSLLIAAQRGATCLAFEPVRSTFASLVENCHANPELDITTFNVALGPRPSRIEITALPLSGINNIQTAQVDQAQPPMQAATQISLDQLQVANLAAINAKLVVKIDVENYEVNVLRGARTTLALNRPLALCIESNQANLPEVSMLLGDSFKSVIPSFYPLLSRTTDNDTDNHFFVNQHWPGLPG